MRAYILSSIIKRDFKETSRNPQTLIILGITIGINVFMSLAVNKNLWIMTFSMSLVMIGFTITSFMITEEKDKKTLDALLVSPANYNEILFGKLFLTFFLTVIITLTLIFSLHHTHVSIIHTLLSVPIGALIICLFGVVMGLICHTQAMLSGFGTILMLALFLPELLAPTNDLIGYIARALPTHHVVQIASLGKNGLGITIAKHYGILLLSLMITIFWVISFIKTASIQENNKWQYEKSNKFLTALLLLTLVFSSYVFLPIKGRIIHTNNENHQYLNNEYKISIPFNPKKFKMKEYRFQNKYVVRFSLIDSPDHHIYLTMEKNIKKIDRKNDLKEMLIKIKKEGVINLKNEEINITEKLIFNKLEYESQAGPKLFYMFSTKEFLYRTGIGNFKKKNHRNYSILSDSLEKNIIKINY